MNNARGYFKKHYRGGYESQKNNPTNRKKIREIVSLGYKSGKLIDIGCAYGYFLLEAKTAGFDVIGVEVSKHAADKAAHISKSDIQTIDVCNTPIKGHGYSVCTLLNSFEHLENYSRALKNIKRVLRKKGLIFIFIPTQQRWLTDQTHVNYFTTQTLRFVLEKEGFEVIKIGLEGGLLQTPFGIIRLLFKRNTLFNFVPFFGSFISCYAYKK